MRSNNQRDTNITTVTITYTNSRYQRETGTFEVIRRSDVPRQQRLELIDEGYDSIIADDLEDDGVATVEKLAAAAAGLTAIEAFYVKKI